MHRVVLQVKAANKPFRFESNPRIRRGRNRARRSTPGASRGLVGARLLPLRCPGIGTDARLRTSHGRRIEVHATAAANRNNDGADRCNPLEKLHPVLMAARVHDCQRTMKSTVRGRAGVPHAMV